MSFTDVSNYSPTEFFEEFFRLSKRKLAFGCLVFDWNHLPVRIFDSN